MYYVETITLKNIPNLTKVSELIGQSCFYAKKRIDL